MAAHTVAATRQMCSISSKFSFLLKLDYCDFKVSLFIKARLLDCCSFVVPISSLTAAKLLNVV